jgi:uncharacterized membrane protein YphA (DoxX/SURF4 family)
MRFPDLGRARGLLLLEAASFKPLAVFRIGIAFVLLAQVQVLWRFREILLAEEGPIPWAVTDRILDPLLPRLSTFAAVLGPPGIGPEQVTAMFLALHAVAALLLLVGWRTRIAALVAWGTYLPLRYTAHLFFYGIGSMLLIGLFYCVILPVGRAWSLDALRRAREAAGDALDASLSIAVLRIHVCIVYLAAGLSKAVGEQWWSGEAVWRSLSLPRFQQYDLQAAAAFPLLLQAAALGAVAVQLAYPVLVWTRFRAAIVLVTELMHLAIAVFLGLWLFSAVMIVFNLAAFGESLWNALRRWSRATARA